MYSADPETHPTLPGIPDAPQEATTACSSENASNDESSDDSCNEDDQLTLF